jgi:hypothetical protein
MKHHRALILLALAPAVVDAQSLAGRIDEVRDGIVRFNYAARPDVCGDGREIIRRGDMFFVFPSTSGYGHGNRDDLCVAGPVRVSIDRSRGESVRYRVHVGGRWNSDADADAEDLGTVSAADAAHYLLDVARREHGEAARYTLAAAALADSVELVPELAAIARDAKLDREVRQNAVYWIGSFDEVAERPLRDLASDASIDEDVRGAAIIALGRDDSSDDDLVWLRRLYPSLSEKLRSDVFLAASQSDSPRASAWLAEVVANDAETEHTREQALFWLGQGRGATSELVGLYDRLDRPDLRRHYTFVISQRHDDVSLEKLIDIAGHDPDRDVRRQALFWLGQSKDPRALAFLRDLVTR